MLYGPVAGATPGAGTTLRGEVVTAGACTGSCAGIVGGSGAPGLVAGAVPAVGVVGVGVGVGVISPERRRRRRRELARCNSEYSSGGRSSKATSVVCEAVVGSATGVATSASGVASGETGV